MTSYFYDLNSNPVYREYPNGTEEMREFDAMNRLTYFETYLNMGDVENFNMTYQYDAVGSARKMIQDSDALAGKAQDAVTTWAYDDRYRLTNETVGVVGGTNYVTSYSWDDADNRLSKTALEIYNGTTTTVESVTYTNNALNQMTDWYDSAADKDVSYQYDANGARTNKIELTTNHTNYTKYVYDEDNRLVDVSIGPNAQSLTPNSSFAYDYRSRRYYRSTPTATNFCVFDGGLSIQEYSVPQASSLPSVSTLTTEFVRGEGMGGGVGGMVYSIKDGGTTNEAIICSHANHRGDVIARSDEDGSLTSFALYEAYGTRPYEWGDDPDRQKANTKEEETDLGLLNEGMRYRDLDTGTFLTRDPIGYADGPNVYCYVHCNPITYFDAIGLEIKEAIVLPAQYVSQRDVDRAAGLSGRYDGKKSGYMHQDARFDQDWRESPTVDSLVSREGIISLDEKCSFQARTVKEASEEDPFLLIEEQEHADKSKEVWDKYADNWNKIDGKKVNPLSRSAKDDVLKYKKLLDEHREKSLKEEERLTDKKYNGRGLSPKEQERIENENRKKQEERQSKIDEQYAKVKEHIDEYKEEQKEQKDEE